MSMQTSIGPGTDEEKIARQLLKMLQGENGRNFDFFAEHAGSVKRIQLKCMSSGNLVL
jgi:hypothetical protein